MGGSIGGPSSATPAGAGAAAASSTASDNAKEECLVCQADDMAATIRLACCNAAAHITCLARWLRRSQHCPHCRTFLREPEANLSSSASSTSQEELDRVDTALLDDDEEDGGMRVEHTSEPAGGRAALEGGDDVERRFRQFQRRMRAPRASPRPVIVPSSASSPQFMSQNGSLAGPASGASSPQPPPGAPPPIPGVTDGGNADGTPPRWVGGYRTNMRGPSVSMEDLSLAGGAGGGDDLGESVSQGFESGSFVRHGASSNNNSASTFGNGHQGGHYSSGLTPPMGYAQPPAHAGGYLPHPQPVYASGAAEHHRHGTPPYLHPSNSSGSNNGGFYSSTSPQQSAAAAPGTYNGSGSGGSNYGGYGGSGSGNAPMLRREQSSGVFAPALPQQFSSQGDSFAGAPPPLGQHHHRRQASMQSLQSEYAAGGSGMRQVSINDSFARDGTYRSNPYGPAPNPVE
jgi:hypothetical protein